MTDLAKDYTPPVISLEEACKEYEIKITKDDLLTIDNIQGILGSGVNEVTLVFSKEKNRLEVKGDFKSVTCTNVKVKTISNPGNLFDNLEDTKIHIQCSHWMFPCPNYNHDTIKRNLERAICAIMEIGRCEVESFSTGIVNYTND